MSHREEYFNILKGNRPSNMPFVPDITDWYNGNHTPKGIARIHGPGCYIPDNDPVKDYDGTIPEKFRGMSLNDIYRKYDWGFHAHIYDWCDTEYDNGIVKETIYKTDEYECFIRTDRGTLSRKYKLAFDGTWCAKGYWVKDESDIDLLMYIIGSEKYVPKYNYVKYIIDSLGDMGEADISISRSPFGKLIHEYFGFENTSYFLMDYPEKIKELLELQEIRDLEVVKLACDSPAKLVYVCDHADENLISPTWYRDYCIPFYKKANKMLHEHGKIVSTHLDGNFKGFFPYIKDTDFDVLDGCTPAPMFNYELEELAAVMPDNMYAFVGVPSALFCTDVSNEEIFAIADRIMSAFKGKAVLNVGDILPPNGNIDQVIALGEYVKSKYI